MLTVSRSVDRVFQIMELFSAKRRPLSATEIRHALGMPHSSAVSVLTRLVALGYLDQNGETKRFFPSLRLHRLCETVPEAVLGGDPLARLADSVQSQTEETTSISRLDGLFTRPIYVHCATHSRALRVIPGLTGGLATHSVVGRTLLSTLPDEELERFLARASYWAKRARVTTHHEPQEIIRTIEFVRAHGYLCTDSLLLEGVGAVSCPLPLQHAGARLAITVAGPSDHIQRRSPQLIDVLLRELRTFVQHPAPARPAVEVTRVAAQRAATPQPDSARLLAL